jgi:hypothetical protein
LRRRFARFKSATGRTRCRELGTHFLNARSELFNLFLQILHLLMLF